MPPENPSFAPDYPAATAAPAATPVWGAPGPSAPTPPPPATAPWPGYGYGYPPPPAPPRRSWTGWIIGAVVIAVLVIAGIAVAAGWFVSNANGAKQAANHYLAALEAGQYPQAYSMLCPADQAFASQAAFVAAKTAEHPVSYSIQGASLQTHDGDDLSWVSYREQESDGWSGTGTVPVVKSGGHWTICHATVGDEAALLR